jgi:hypothetical protein
MMTLTAGRTTPAGLMGLLGTRWSTRRQCSTYRYFRIHPQRLQAWREANELEGRELMRGGRWLVP